MSRDGRIANCLALLALLGGCAAEPAPGAAPYGHTVDFTGGTMSGFADEDELFVSDGMNYRIAWDADHLFVSFQGADFSDTVRDAVVVYLGYGSGTHTGLTLGGQTPTLPFAALWAFGVAPDGNPRSWRWNGFDWVAEYVIDGGLVNYLSPHAALAVPFAAVGDPATFALHVSAVATVAGGETTFGPCPAESFINGFDPDYTAYYRFDRRSPMKPNDYAPLP